MSKFSGTQQAGAARRHREKKREEAEARNAATPHERRRAFRRELSTALEGLRGSQGTTKKRKVKGK